MHADETLKNMLLNKKLSSVAIWRPIQVARGWLSILLLRYCLGQSSHKAVAFMNPRESQWQRY